MVACAVAEDSIVHAEAAMATLSTLDAKQQTTKEENEKKEPDAEEEKLVSAPPITLYASRPAPEILTSQPAR